MKLFYIMGFISSMLLADGFYAKISPITQKIKQRMIKGNSWRYGCPVEIDDLRYLQIKYWNFEGKSKLGELVVHKKVAKNIVSVFSELYSIKYPIKQMQLVSDFKGSDWKSIEADNTSALNCRKITGNNNKWSNHAYGKAIDVNPIENPYISKNGHISHKISFKYRKRVHNSVRGLSDKAILIKNDKVVQIFKKHGWKWGGDWKYVKDYQHFEYSNKDLN